MNYFSLGIATISIIIAILLYSKFKAYEAKLKKSIFIREENDEIILEDYEGNKIAKKIKI